MRAKAAPANDSPDRREEGLSRVVQGQLKICEALEEWTRQVRAHAVPAEDSPDRREEGLSRAVQGHVKICEALEEWTRQSQSMYEAHVAAQTRLADALLEAHRETLQDIQFLYGSESGAKVSFPEERTEYLDENEDVDEVVRENVDLGPKVVELKGGILTSPDDTHRKSPAWTQKDEPGPKVSFVRLADSRAQPEPETAPVGAATLTRRTHKRAMTETPAPRFSSTPEFRKSMSTPIRRSCSTESAGDVSSLERELLETSGPYPELRAVVVQDNMISLKDLLERNPRVAYRIKRADNVMDGASDRCKAMLESYVSTIPFSQCLPPAVRQDVYLAATRLALQYARAGVEGSIHGHILVLGEPDELLALGTQNKFDPFQNRQGDIREPADAEEVRRCMDADGMTLIDGLTGTPVANKFFSRGTSANASGGARSKSALWMAEEAFAMVIKVSEDSKGEITLHLGDGPDGMPETEVYSTQMCKHSRTSLLQLSVASVLLPLSAARGRHRFRAICLLVLAFAVAFASGAQRPTKLLITRLVGRAHR